MDWNVGISRNDLLIPELAQRPTAVMLYGTNSPLLNWLLYSLLVRGSPSFVWTDVRERADRLDPLDPLSRPVMAPTRLHVVEPHLWTPEPPPSPSVPDLSRTEELPEDLRRLVDSLRFPSHLKEAVSPGPASGPVPLIGVSNVHRLLPAFTVERLERTVRAIVDSGTSLVLTLVGPVPAGALSQFEIGVEGEGPAAWKDAVLVCTAGDSVGPVRAGRRLRLGDLPQVAGVLGPLKLDRS